ncbi:MAG: hypothetical protein KDA84_14770, partial [Planctomycetaceae bacterium]|nr:hypothetical protein [Planctomycetaceae bacterium]
MLNRLSIVSLGLLAGLLMVGTGASRAYGQEQSKRDLLNLVGDDAGLCVEVSGLTHRLPQF